jgi:serine/threonine-protein kinase
MVAMPPLQHVDRQTFLRNLRRSGLFSAEQLAHARELLPATDRGRLLARALVEQGLLTRFQAERVLVGRTDGFLLDQYVILEELGRGGMGRVYKARHRTMGRVVALKILAPDLTRTERARAMFLREVRAVAQLAHPNLVAAFDANLVGDRYYLVLEYIDGPNLEQLVRARGPLDVGLACDFARQVACGLHCAHKAGMVHRDIKPSNLLVQRRANDGAPALVKVSDFGLARLQENGDDERPGTILMRPNTVMGTPDYLSPEQARSLHDTDHRTDLYSLGCTLYFLLSGQVPFPGGTSIEKLIRHNTEEPNPLEQLRSDVPLPVAALVRQLMAKKPDDRLQTAAEVVQVLEPFSVSGSTPWDGLSGSGDNLPNLVTPPPEQGTDPAMRASEGSSESITPQSADPFAELPTVVPTFRQPAARSRALVWGMVAVGVLLALAAAYGAYLAG